MLFPLPVDSEPDSSSELLPILADEVPLDDVDVEVLSLTEVVDESDTFSVVSDSAFLSAFVDVSASDFFAFELLDP